ncbi:hypothetical protein BD324DRAFT_668589 [Kockovaella imperatae]|uniref:ER membrane protein complex subunit 1 n=1 Tax=Kockovaella imperatae TaxID=4999 RepID=A0A1Y1U8T4_9TREE|nr:hypothetical protein BD324DRAFT_668589 [Kockovaella imperatae]ORX33525.1 hypothetical protein BD324DRAFT_668589 [Kockovaella imperatae]
MVVLAFLLSFLFPVLAIQANVAGIVDWHKPLIGEPHLGPTPPGIYDTSKGRRVVSLTKKNVLACIDAKTGDIAWRHLFDEKDPVVSYHVHGDDVILLSGSGGATARSISMETGRVTWEKTLLPESVAQLTVPVHLGTDVGFSDDSVLVLSNGRRITRLAIKSGNQLWSLEAPGVGDTILFKQLLVSGPTVHILALSSGFSKTSLTTLSLSLETSEPRGDLIHVPSIISNPSQALLAAASTPGSAQVVWAEHGRIRTAEVDTHGTLGKTKDLMPGQGHVYDRILEVDGRHQGYILGQKENMAVQIIRVKDGAQIIDEFDSSHHSADKSDSVYAASSLKDSLTFSRVYWTFNMNAGVAQTYTLQGTTSISTAFTFSFDTASHGVLQGLAIAPTIGPKQMPQILLSTSSGASLLVEQEATRWIREESLADLAAVRFVTLGEPAVEQVGHLLTEETFVHRLGRHIFELKDLPGFTLRLVKRMMGKQTTALIPMQTASLHRDQFGFQQVLIAVTRSGKVFALDSSNGYVLWTTNLGTFSSEGSNLHVEDMWVVREVGEGVNPTLAVIATREAAVSYRDVVGYHIDAFTGHVSGDEDDLTHVPKGKTLFQGHLKAAFITRHEHCGTNNKVIAVVDSSDTVYLFPACKKVARALANDTMTYTSLTKGLGTQTLTGYKIGQAVDLLLSSAPQWSYRFSDGEVLGSIAPAGFDSIASFGRVLGDKSTFYKYLNPHLVVMTSTHPLKQTGSVTVLDSVTGRTVYTATMDNVDSARGVIATMSENWLVFTWLETGVGYRMTSVELYEDGNKGQTPGTSSYAQTQDLKVISQSFIAPSGVRQMVMTRSKFGITMKELVYVNDRGQVAHIARRVLDPRRPTGKPTSSDKEEMLIPFDPMIPPDPKRVISHNNQVLGATCLTSSPAHVESTSLLFAHGLDLFFTRGLTPSGSFDILSDAFNKPQLVFTLLTLLMAIRVSQPIIKGRLLKAKWN